MTARLARVSPTEPMLYKDWVIPAGVSKLLWLTGCNILVGSLPFLEKVADTCCIPDSRQSVKLLRPHGSHTLPRAREIRPGALDPRCR